MNGPIEVNAERGTQQLLTEAGHSLQQALARRGPQAGIACLNTLYYLPVALGMLAKPVQRVADLQPIFAEASSMRQRGRAALLAAEIIEALRAPDGDFLSPVSDLQIHSWGIQLADGRMPGIALLLGRAVSPDAAWELIEELRRHNILCLLGNGVQVQLKEGDLEPASDHHVIPLGEHASSAAHALGATVRCAMKLGGYLPGSSAEIRNYCKRRMSGFVLALGGLNEQDYAIALGAEEFGFPWIESQGGAENAADLVQRCISVRGLKPKRYNVQLPMSYGPAFEGEAIPDDELHIHFGGPDCHSFVLLQVAAPDAVMDGKVEVLGPALPNRPQRGSPELGIVVTLAGSKLQSDYEPYLERQVPAYISYIRGVEFSGRPDELLLRVSKEAVASGLDLETLGRVIHARFREDFPEAVQSVQVTLITDPARHAEWLEKARTVHAKRAERLASLTDAQVDVFYACTNCRPIAPRNVSIISPERVSPCGQCTWLDAQAAFELNASGARRPIALGRPIDIQKGIWEGTNQYAQAASQGRIQQVSLYSIMETPMAACADFQCMVVLIPEANGVMVLRREDAALVTPAGLTIETFSSLAAGEQIPGIVGIGQSHLLSRQFLAPEGGFRRVVWMSSRLKESLWGELQAVCAREGDPDLMQKIADERQVTTVDQLLHWLQDRGHPALEMSKMF